GPAADARPAHRRRLERAGLHERRHRGAPRAPSAWRPAPMKYATILHEAADGVVTITLNRPEVHNAMKEQMRQELTRCFGDLATSDAARVVVVTGAGERAFSAGADIRGFVVTPVPVRYRVDRKHDMF